MVEIIDASGYESEFINKVVSDRYQEFQEHEGIPVHVGFSIRDFHDLETGPWSRTGQQGAFVNLYGMESLCDVHIHEIEPAGEMKTQSHFYNEKVFVAEGRGGTVMESGGTQFEFEWEAGALFAIPRNATFRHVNHSNEDPARLVAKTDLPQIIDIVMDEGFIFSSDYDFVEKYESEGLYSSEGETSTVFETKLDSQGSAIRSSVPITWQSNYIPDVRNFDVFEKDEWNTLGALKIIRLDLPILQTQSQITDAHLSEIPTGRYKNAHRHQAASDIFILSGEGYSLLWRDGMDKKLRVDWGAGSIFTPPASWWHHHFNIGREPATQLVMHAPPLGLLNAQEHAFDPHSAENNIEYVDEDPQTRALYEAELEERGITYTMPEECFTDPNFEF